MPRLEIDQLPVDAPEGATILEAARAAGVDIPTLCHHDGFEPATSCMLCIVRVKNSGRLVPACATPIEDGMVVENETDEIRELRRAGLELILSDHVGDCTAPCHHTCPADMNIPLMLSAVNGGDFRSAIAIVKKDLALPAVLGRVCPAPCEHNCRRSRLDNPVSICLIERRVADADLASDSPYLPACAQASGRTVAVVGAGPTGITAAYHLQQAGHACTVFEREARAGGKLRRQFAADVLPPEVLDAEIAVVERLGARFELESTIDSAAALAALGDRFDAVLVAGGALDAATGSAPFGLHAVKGRVQVDPRTGETSRPGVFAAGDAVRPSELIVRSVADGKAVALCIDQYLRGEAVIGSPRPFAVRVGRVEDEELVQLRAGAAAYDRVVPAQNPAGGMAEIEALAEADRCLHCECGQRDCCRLQQLAARYGARKDRYGSSRRPLERRFRHAEIVHEPGKCILCGLCIQAANEAGEPLGLTFIGRGFDMQLGTPFDCDLDEALRTAALRCAEVCPTGALAHRPRAVR